MKKLLLSLMFISISSAAMANFYLDLGYSRLDGGDAKVMSGVTWALAFNLHKEYLLKYRGSMTMFSDQKDLNSKLDDVENEHQIHTVGLEYLIPIPEYKLMIRPSLMGGICMTNLQTGKDEFQMENGDMGISLAAFVGLDYHATQYISPFLELGYHYSNYSINYGLVDTSILGYVVNLGVRFAFGGNRDIYQDY